MMIVLLVVFVMTMFIWLLGLLGASPAANSPWLAWFACLCLGIAVFLIGAGGIMNMRF